jgi:hypothetical protein
MAYTKLWIPGNKDPTMKAPHANGVSNEGTTPLSVINLLNVSYAWVMGIVKTSVTTYTNAVRLPSHAKFTPTIPDSIMLVVHKASFTIILSS